MSVLPYTPQTRKGLIVYLGTRKKKTWLKIDELKYLFFLNQLGETSQVSVKTIEIWVNLEVACYEKKS